MVLLFCKSVKESGGLKTYSNRTLVHIEVWNTCALLASLNLIDSRASLLTQNQRRIEKTCFINLFLREIVWHTSPLPHRSIEQRFPRKQTLSSFAWFSSAPWKNYLIQVFYSKYWKPSGTVRKRESVWYGWHMIYRFYKFLLREEDREETAFSTHIGRFQLKRLPLGLRNAPSTYQQVANTLAKQTKKKFRLLWRRCRYV